ncbi:hypothetical protein [Moorena sp. SIOASIH]|nr:hypothetical protein [Moorena sp. SIOASIH]
MVNTAIRVGILRIFVPYSLRPVPCSLCDSNFDITTAKLVA